MTLVSGGPYVLRLFSEKENLPAALPSPSTVKCQGYISWISSARWVFYGAEICFEEVNVESMGSRHCQGILGTI